MGWLYVCGAVGFVVNILAVGFIFVGSWYPTGFPDLKVWNYWMVAFTAVSVITGVAIYRISRQTRRGTTAVERGALREQRTSNLPVALAGRRRRGPAFAATRLARRV